MLLTMPFNFSIKSFVKPAHLVFGLMGAVVLWFASAYVISFAPPAVVLPAAALFKVEVVESKSKQVFQEVISRGSVVAFKSISLYSKSSGQIDQIVALKGSRVKKGDVLIRIKNEDQAQKLEQAKALALQRQMEYKAAQELTHKSFSSEISLAGAKTALESALAGFATAQQNYNNLFITAPFDGIFNSTDLDEGSSAVSFLTFGSAIGSMIDLSSIKVVLQIPEKDALGLKVGNEAFLSLPYIYAKDMEKGIRGKITYVSQAADPKLRTFRAEILAPNPDTSLYEGMTVEAKIPVKSLDAHLVNFSILTLNDKGDVGVKAVDEQGKVIFYPVTPLKTEKEKLWVEGLPSNCNIISMGQDFVTAGQKVDVSRKGK